MQLPNTGAVVMTFTSEEIPLTAAAARVLVDIFKTSAEKLTAAGPGAVVPFTLTCEGKTLTFGSDLAELQRMIGEFEEVLRVDSERKRLAGASPAGEDRRDRARRIE